MKKYFQFAFFSLLTWYSQKLVWAQETQATDHKTLKDVAVDQLAGVVALLAHLVLRVKKRI